MPIKSKKIKIEDNASASLSAWLFVQAKRKGKAEKQIKCCKQRNSCRSQVQKFLESPGT